MESRKRSISQVLSHDPLLYKRAVWNELKVTMQEWDRLLDLSQDYNTAHMVSKEKLDRLRLKINGLMSQLDDARRISS